MNISTYSLKLVKTSRIIFNVKIDFDVVKSLEDFMEVVKKASEGEITDRNKNSVSVICRGVLLSQENCIEQLRSHKGYQLYLQIKTPDPEWTEKIERLREAEERRKADEKVVSDRLLLPRPHEKTFGSIHVKRLISAEWRALKSPGDYTDSFERLEGFLAVKTLLKNPNSRIDAGTIDLAMDFSLILLQQSFQGSEFTEAKIEDIVAGFRSLEDLEGDISLRGFLKKYIGDANKRMKEMVGGLLNYVDLLLKMDHASRANSLGQFPNSLAGEGTYRACIQGAIEKLDSALMGLMQRGPVEMIIPGKEMTLREKLLLKKAVGTVEAEIIESLGDYGQDVHARPSLSRVLGINDGDGDFLPRYYDRVGMTTDKKWELYRSWPQRINIALDNVAIEHLRNILGFIKGINISTERGKCFYDDKKNIYYKKGATYVSEAVTCKKFAQREYILYFSTEGFKFMQLKWNNDRKIYVAFDDDKIEFVHNKESDSYSANGGSIIGAKIVREEGYYNIANEHEIVASVILDAQTKLTERLQELSVIGFGEELSEEFFYLTEEDRGEKWLPTKDLVFQLKRFFSPTFFIEDKKIPGSEESILTSVTDLRYTKRSLSNYYTALAESALNKEVQTKLINVLRSFVGREIKLQTDDDEAIQAEHSAALNLLFQCYGGLCSKEAIDQPTTTRQRDQYIVFIINLGIGLLEHDEILSYIARDGDNGRFFQAAAEAARLLLLSKIDVAKHDIHEFMKDLLTEDFEWIERECGKESTIERLRFNFSGPGEKLKFLMRQATAGDTMLLGNMTTIENDAINTAIIEHIYDRLEGFILDRESESPEFLLHSYIFCHSKLRISILGVPFIDKLINKGYYKALLLLLQENIDKDIIRRRIELNADLKEQLIKYSSEKGDVVAMKNLLDIGVSDDRKIIALTAAVQNGHKAMVKMLLDAGATVSIDYFSDLLCQANRMEIIDILADHPSSDIHSYFFVALLRGRDDIAYDFLYKKEGADALDADGKSFLHHAVSAGNLIMVKNLTNIHLLDVNAADNHGVTPLMIAVYHSHDEVIAELLKKEADFYYCLTATQEKLSDENILKLLRLIKESGVTVELARLMPILSGKSLALKSKISELFSSAEQIENLFKAGDVATLNTLIISNRQDIKENAVKFLSHVAILDNEEQARQLIALILSTLNPEEKSAILNASYGRNEPLLFILAKKGHKSLINFLAREGADVNICNSKGNNLIMEMVEGGRLDMIESVAELSGIDFSVINAEGDSILTLIVKIVEPSQYNILLRLSLERGADIVKFAEYCFKEFMGQEYPDPDYLSELLQLLKPKDSRLHDILKMALEYYDVKHTCEVVDIMNKHPLHKFNFNPIHIATQIAAQNDNVDAIYILCRFADVNSRDEYGETALEKLITQSLEKDGIKKNYLGMVQALISNGARVDSKIKGKSLLYHIASLAAREPGIIAVDGIFNEIFRKIGGLEIALGLLDTDIIDSRDYAVIEYIIIKSYSFETDKGNLLYKLAKTIRSGGKDLKIEMMLNAAFRSADEETITKNILEAFYDATRTDSIITSGAGLLYYKLLMRKDTHEIYSNLIYKTFKERDEEKRSAVLKIIIRFIRPTEALKEKGLYTGALYKAIINCDLQIIQFLYEDYREKIEVNPRDLIKAITDTTKHKSEKDLIAVIEFLSKNTSLNITRITREDGVNLFDFAIYTEQEELARYCQACNAVQSALKELCEAIAMRDVEKVGELCNEKMDHIVLIRQVDLIDYITLWWDDKSANKLINIVKILAEFQIIDLNSKNSEGEDLQEFATKLHLSELQKFLNSKATPAAPKADESAAASSSALGADVDFLRGMADLKSKVAKSKATDSPSIMADLIEAACGALEILNAGIDQSEISGGITHEFSELFHDSEVSDTIMTIAIRAKSQGLTPEALKEKLIRANLQETPSFHGVGSPAARAAAGGEYFL